MKMILLITLISITTSFFFKSYAIEPRVEFKNQQQSVTNWKNISLKSFLSFKEWKEESDSKSQVPEWEKIIRERNHRELVGKIYQCVGLCRVDRGESFFNGSYKTGLYEGDEVQTIGDSYAWIFLFDGTMVRMSPKSSITFNELNIGVKENFLNARINVGNVLWLSRSEKTFSENNIRETDVIFFPYSEYESLPINEKKLYLEDDLLELISENKSIIQQYKTLNEAVLSNNKITRAKPTYAFLVTPNATIMGMSPSVEVVTLIGGKTYIKKRSSETLQLKSQDEITNDLFLQLRGFENTALTTMQDDLWITVDERGRNYEKTVDTNWLNMGEFLTKRIPSIMLAREIFLKRLSEFAFREKYDPVALAKNDGYRIWGKLGVSENSKKEDLEQRLDFLKEYFRRVETSNLLSSAKIRQRIQERGDNHMLMEYGRYFFITALNKYYRYGEIDNVNSSDKETGEVLNSTKKLLWKKMHGIR